MSQRACSARVFHNEPLGHIRGEPKSSHAVIDDARCSRGHLHLKPCERGERGVAVDVPWRGKVAGHSISLALARSSEAVRPEGGWLAVRRQYIYRSSGSTFNENYISTISSASGICSSSDHYFEMSKRSVLVSGVTGFVGS